MSDQPSYYNPQWGRQVPIDEPLYALMTEHGFVPYHTGGGCMSWSRDEVPANGDSILLGIEGSLGEWKDRDEPIWVVGRYSESDYCGFVEVYDVTLAQAIELSATLRAPDGQEQASYRFSEFQEVAK